MSKGRGPSATVKATRKDGEEITYTDYRGEEQTRKAVKIASIWTNERGYKSISFEACAAKIIAKQGDFWFNVYDEDGSKRGNGQRPAPRDDEAGDDDFA